VCFLLPFRMSLRQWPRSVDKRDGKQAGAAKVAGSEVSGLKQPSSNSSGRHSFIILGVIVALCAYTYLASHTAALSNLYALCSRDGSNIYTVDERNSQTQCIVVHGSYIVDTGSLRKFSIIHGKRCSDSGCRGRSGAVAWFLIAGYHNPSGLLGGAVH
jgi:hypothetical protein